MTISNIDTRTAAKQALLTPARLCEVMAFSHDEPAPRWRISMGSRAGKGDIAGAINKCGYRHIKIDGHVYYAHRLAWLHFHGRWPDDMIDHINGDRADNRICNLREATNSQNMQNTGKPSTNKSGHKGVCWDKCRQKWAVEIRINGYKIHLGRFYTIENALAHYAQANARYHGSFGRII